VGANRRNWLGSALLVVLSAVVILRPWEELRVGEEKLPAAASAYVTRAVDGDTIEVRLDGRLEDVRYIGMLSRVSRPTLRLPAAVTG
jgi:endonuclease YncB( thermonuclease family)